jgi:surface antigen
MWKKNTLAVAAATMMIGTAIEASNAQPYNDPYYNNQYNDRNYDQQNYDRDYRPPPPPPPSYANEQYRHDYRAEDDPAYNDCRRQRANNQAGGLIIGAIAGGLFGNAITRGPSRGPGTVLGAIGGGALGAAIGGNLNCDDRDLAYRTYYSGFERGRTHARYPWRSPRTGAYGYLEVNDYFRDRDGYRCARYTQEIWVQGRPETASGIACKQPNGAWAFVS